MTGKGLYKGRGGYWGRAFGNLFGLGDLGDKLGDAASSVISSVVPGGKQAMDLVSSDIGQGLGKLASSITGQGMYKRGRGLYRGKGLYKGRGEYVATNGLIASNDVVPQFGQNDMKEILIQNREFVADVYAPQAQTTFAAQEYPINPGIKKLWQWLAQIAINFEEYEIKQLIITYKSTVADFASASGQVGQIVMATQYNPSSDPFGSKEEMMLYEGGMSCKTTENMQHGIECDPSKLTGSTFKYVRAGNLPITEDIKEYDLGRFSLAVLGCPSTYAGQQLGELWVSYTVSLRKPKVASGHAYNIQRDVFAVPTWNTSTTFNPPLNSLLKGTRNCGIATVHLAPSVEEMIGANYVGLDIMDFAAPYANNAALGTGFYRFFTLRFDDSFEGCVAIRFRKNCLVSMSTLATRELVVFSSIRPGTDAATIVRFDDIPDVRNSPYLNFWTHWLSTIDNTPIEGPTTGGTQTDNRLDLDLHLRILPPQNGRRNELYFGWAGQGSDNCQLHLELTQYNTFLSASDNGRGTDNLLFSDVNDGIYTWANPIVN
jgi:hypothetical protein